MPSNADFTMRILVGGAELPEYEKDGVYYVESDLFTAHSYEFIEEEISEGQRTTQRWPVTPYTIRVTAGRDTPVCHYRIYVDGQRSHKLGLKPSETKISDGFRDQGNVHEYLFSLPRAPTTTGERSDVERACKIGTIEVECWNGVKEGFRKTRNGRHLHYSHANKNDCKIVTEGEYQMMTTRKGKKVNRRSRHSRKWKLVSLRSKLSVKYRTMDSLRDMKLSTRTDSMPTVSNGDVSEGVHTGSSENKIAAKREVPSIWNWSDSDDDDVVITDVIKPKRRKTFPVKSESDDGDKKEVITVGDEMSDQS